MLAKLCHFITVLGIFILLCFSLFVYARYLEPYSLVEKNIQLTFNDVNAQNQETLKIVHFSDVHLSSQFNLTHFQKVVDEMNDMEPDFVVFTGDLMDIPSQFYEREELSELLASITSRYGKLAIWGNHDYGGGGVRFYEQLMTEGGFTVLKNNAMNYKINDKSVNFIGLDDGLLGTPDSNASFENLSKSDLNILLLHEPDLINDIKTDSFDLALAGHSHGGQIQLPFIGPLLTPLLAKDYTHDLYELSNESYLYVSPGIGTTKLPLRFLAPPTLTCFTLNF